MTCCSAVEKKGVTLSPKDTIEKALKALKKSKITTASVVDDEGAFLGLFSMGILLKNLIPVPITTSSGIQIDIKIKAMPGVAKRLRGLLPLSVAEVVERNPVKVLPEEPIWEVVGRLVAYCEPLCVIDEDGKYMGLITYESLINELKNSLNE
ncbi:MAG: CBS domain-containing protein [Alphaproteobacteria bacterium]|nr:CBS domain-containing protein [Alphaproteobacteria bacterium]